MRPSESTTELYSHEKFNLNLIHLNYNNNYSGVLTVNITTKVIRCRAWSAAGTRFCPLDARSYAAVATLSIDTYSIDITVYAKTIVQG